MSKSPLIAADADRWIVCAGSVQAEASHPAIAGQRNETREEGIACHKIAMEMLRSYQDPNATILAASDYIDTLSDNGVVITVELMDSVLEYVNDVLEYCNANGRMQHIKIESRVNLEHIYPGMHGFCDCWDYNPDMMTLTIWEGKYGRTVVEPFENPQQTEYLTGIIKELGLTSPQIQNLFLEFRVVQPRAWHHEGTIRSWCFEYYQIAQVLDRLKNKALESMSENPSCVPGPHCSGCNARDRCGALTRAGHIAMNVAMGVEDATLNGAELGYELSTVDYMVSILKARKTGLEEQAKALIKSGKSTVPGWDIQQGYGRQRWIKSKPISEIIEEAELLYDFQMAKLTADCTPKQAITRGLDPDFVEMYSETPLGELKLMQDDGSKARQAFGKKQ